MGIDEETIDEVLNRYINLEEKLLDNLDDFVKDDTDKNRIKKILRIGIKSRIRLLKEIRKDLIE